VRLISAVGRRPAPSDAFQMAHRSCTAEAAGRASDNYLFHRRLPGLPGRAGPGRRMPSSSMRPVATRQPADTCDRPGRSAPSSVRSFGVGRRFAGLDGLHRSPQATAAAGRGCRPFARDRRRRLGRSAGQPARDRTLTPWAIVLRGSGVVVGFCGFFARPVKGTTMGYAIVPQFRGQGLATEAAAAVLDWAERHGVDVYASIRPPNPASARVLEKIGMRRVGSYRDGDGRRDIYRRRRAS
jgi:GNAT superfamily N-acetyltransferase